MSDLRYPIGKFAPPETFSGASRAAAIAAIAALPGELSAVVAGLDEAQLDTPYRDGGWTVRQVVHHLPDSHLNAYVRHKLAMTEDEPTIRPYQEARWAELPEATSAEPELSLRLLDALHARWARFLGSLDDAAFARVFIHPDHGRRMSLDWSVGMYAWHGRHHTAHIRALRERRSW
jgi:hypothetical protein